MSWDTYVGNMEGEGCCYAALCDLEGNKWAESQKSSMGAVSIDQVKTLVNGINKVVNLWETGVKLGTRKFLTVDISNDKVGIFKQIGGDSNDKLMMCAALFRTGIVVGASQAGEREKACRISVEKYAEYLKTQGY